MSRLAARPLFCIPLLLLSACAAPGYDSDGPYGDDDDYSAPPAYDGAPLDITVPPEDVVDVLCEGAPAEPTTFFVSADDSNSQAQPAWIRSAIRSGGYWSGAIRPYEFLNYYDFDFGPIASVTLVPELRRTADGLSLLVAVVAPDRAANQRRPMNLTLSLDLSGSMGESGLAGIQSSVRAIAAELRDGDRVSVVEWSESQSVLMNNRVVAGPNDSVLLDLVDGLATGGGTDLDGGLARAYEIASANASPTTLDRVVLISDGGANLGETAADLVAGHAEDGDSDGIYLAAIGAGNLSESFLDTITDLGRGSYLFVDSDAEANRKLRGDAFLATLDLAAREVQLDVTLPEGLVIDVFSGEEISEDPDEVRPQHLAPNDAMLYHFKLVDCLDEADDERTIDLHVQWLEPFLGTPQSADLSVTLGELLSGPSDHVLKADAVLQYADRIARGTEQTDVLLDAQAQLPGDADLQEMVETLQIGGML